MKIAILILTVFILLKPVFPAIEYVVRYDYIKNELCVNKDKPELECNGKCHLKKELAQASEAENSKDKLHLYSVEHHLLFIQDVSPEFSLPFLEQYVVNLPFSYNNLYCFSFSPSILKPPLYV